VRTAHPHPAAVQCAQGEALIATAGARSGSHARGLVGWSPMCSPSCRQAPPDTAWPLRPPEPPSGAVSMAAGASGAEQRGGSPMGSPSPSYRAMPGCRRDGSTRGGAAGGEAETRWRYSDVTKLDFPEWLGSDSEPLGAGEVFVYPRVRGYDVGRAEDDSPLRQNHFEFEWCSEACEPVEVVDLGSFTPGKLLRTPDGRGNGDGSTDAGQSSALTVGDGGVFESRQSSRDVMEAEEAARPTIEHSCTWMREWSEQDILGPATQRSAPAARSAVSAVKRSPVQVLHSRTRSTASACRDSKLAFADLIALRSPEKISPRFGDDSEAPQRAVSPGWSDTVVATGPAEPTRSLQSQAVRCAPVRCNLPVRLGAAVIKPPRSRPGTGA